MKKLSTQKLTVLAGSLAMAAVTLLLTLVCVKSYRWGWFELFHKIDRLMNQHIVFNYLGKTLLVLLLATPLLLCVVAWLKPRTPRVVAALPLLTSLVFIILLFLAGVSPGLGQYLYCAIAAAVLFAAVKE
jgi:hypothetical protein